jgi:hypothetical protein
MFFAVTLWLDDGDAYGQIARAFSVNEKSKGP